MIRRIALFFLIPVLVLSSFVTLLRSDEANACGFNTGYFYCVDRSGSYSVMNDGLPTWIQSKQQFIDYILSKHNANPPGGYQGTSLASMDKMGAAYIIQTMRGGTDHGFPDGGDLNDWVARINNPAVTVGWEYRQADINSRRTNRTGSPATRDVEAFYGDNRLYLSFVFRVNGNTAYIVKQVCANPLGGLSGLPDPLNFSLNPTISGSPSSSEGGGTVNLSPAVNNTGSTNSASVTWRVTSFRVNPGGTVPSGGDSGTDPIPYFGNNAANIGGSSQVFIRGVNTLTIGNQTVGDFPVGTRLCYALSVRPISQSNGNWRHSTPFCVVLAKKPRVQVWGGDLVVGAVGLPAANIRGSTSTKAISGTNRLFGSWGEYGVAASGTITGVASGSAFAGNGLAGATLCKYSELTLANAAAGEGQCTPGTILGGSSLMSALPNIAGQFPVTDDIPSLSVNLDSLTAKRVYEVGPGETLTISGGTLQKGEWIVINGPSSTVNITGNLDYTSGALDSIGDIPQLVIIANRINIRRTVTNVDAWLVAGGTNGIINTCDEVGPTAALTSTTCDLQLVVNGPVIAKTLYLRRTYGAGSGSNAGIPAEVFNLRPDAYIWAAGRAAESGRVRTVYSQELPPRF